MLNDRKHVIVKKKDPKETSQLELKIGEKCNFGGYDYKMNNCVDNIFFSEDPNDELFDIKPDKPIRKIDLPYSYERIFALLIIIILLFFIAYIWNSRNKGKKFLQKVFFNYNPRKDAIKAIKAIKLDNLSNKEF